MVGVLLTGAEGSEFEHSLWVEYVKNSLCSPSSKWGPDSFQSGGAEGDEEDERHPNCYQALVTSLPALAMGTKSKQSVKPRMLCGFCAGVTVPVGELK